MTGGSSGIGRETALRLKAAGCRVYELSRRGGEGEAVHIGCDVSDEAQVKAAFEKIVENEGRIDILVCNAGFGISGAAEFTDNADAKRLMDVNLFGCVNCCREAAAVMRRQGEGRIVCLSSVAGAISIPFQAWYSVSKAAVLSYALALRNELAPFGISVCAILPGDIKTGFTAAREKSSAGSEIYGGRIERSVAGMEKDEQTGMTAEFAGSYVAGIALKANVKPQYGIGLKYKFFLVLFRLLPCRLSSWIVGQMYAK